MRSAWRVAPLTARRARQEQKRDLRSRGPGFERSASTNSTDRPRQSARDKALPCLTPLYRTLLYRRLADDNSYGEMASVRDCTCRLFLATPAEVPHRSLPASASASRRPSGSRAHAGGALGAPLLVVFVASTCKSLIEFVRNAVPGRSRMPRRCGSLVSRGESQRVLVRHFPPSSWPCLCSPDATRPSLYRMRS